MYFTCQNEIDSDLWESISQNYENEKYQNTILDAIFFITKQIRDKTGLDLDGTALVGKVFSGDDPILKINKFITENDKNEQKGFEQILRGIYIGIRNPRAHGFVPDTKDTCDAIILFLNYLYGKITNSKGIFEIQDFIDQITDKEFVETSDYSNILISSIPQIKLLDAYSALIDRRNDIQPIVFKLIKTSIYEKVNDSQKKDMNSLFSDVLIKTTSDHDIHIAVTAYESEKWSDLSMQARLRAENKMLKSFEVGNYNKIKQNCLNGALGTWLSSISSNLAMADRFRSLLIKKISSPIPAERDYIFNYFRNDILPFQIIPEKMLLGAINKGLKDGDINFYEIIKYDFAFSESEYFQAISEAFENFKENDFVPSDFPDDILF